MNQYFAVFEQPSVVWVNNSMIQTRIDSQYYKTNYVENEYKIEKLGYEKLSDIISRGDYGILPDTEDYGNIGVPLIRGTDLRNLSIEIKEMIRVPKTYLSEKSQLQYKDILLLIKGATIDDEWSVSIVPKINEEMIFNGSIFRIRLKSNYDPYFITAFMSTNYFLLQKTRAISNTGIYYNDKDSIGNFLIPIPSPEIQEYIGNKVRRAEELREEAKKLKEDIEEIFEEELELSKIREVKKDVEKQKNKWVRDEEIEERIDGEFYHPRYNFYDKALFNLDKIENHFKISKERINKNYVKEIRYIDLSSINNLISPQLMDIKDAPDRAKLKVKQGDVIISTLSGSKKIGIISYDLDGCICSTGFVVLRCTSSILTPEYLYAIFSNELFNVQIDKYSSGAIMSGVIGSDFKKMLIPIIKNKLVVDKITNNIRNHFNKLSLSNSLIQEAKQDVEDLIEGNFDMSKLSDTTPESR